MLARMALKHGGEVSSTRESKAKSRALEGSALFEETNRHQDPAVHYHVTNSPETVGMRSLRQCAPADANPLRNSRSSRRFPDLVQQKAYDPSQPFRESGHSARGDCSDDLCKIALSSDPSKVTRRVVHATKKEVIHTSPAEAESVPEAEPPGIRIHGQRHIAKLSR